MFSGKWRSDDRGDGSGLRVDADSPVAAGLERRAALDVIASEVSHEIAHTLNFLRVLADDMAAGVSPVAEDAALARREVERLARLMGNLRRLKLAAPGRQAVPLRAVVLRAVEFARAAPRGAQIDSAPSLDGSVTLAADSSLLDILVRDVVIDVARRAAHPGRVEIRVVLPGSSQEGRLEILGSIRSAATAADADRFAPWGAQIGDGIGLAVANRLARLLGWTLEEVVDGLCIHIPAAAFGSESAACES